jgi:hypothetical protein
MRCRFPDREVCPISEKIDVSEYLELSYLVEEGGGSPDKQPRGGFTRKNFRLIRRELWQKIC